mmetsp:Transcript_25647/g.84709  ORF Transcript_25647/g.84709 Transcript_25647/m.84709 type:complete len:226 (+) Transcript_25647:347-1024(+)
MTVRQLFLAGPWLLPPWPASSSSSEDAVFALLSDFLGLLASKLAVHTRTVPSAEEERTRLPAESKEAERTGPLCPRRVETSLHFWGMEERVWRVTSSSSCSSSAFSMSMMSLSSRRLSSEDDSSSTSNPLVRSDSSLAAFTFISLSCFFLLASFSSSVIVASFSLLFTFTSFFLFILLFSSGPKSSFSCPKSSAALGSPDQSYALSQYLTVMSDEQETSWPLSGL